MSTGGSCGRDIANIAASDLTRVYEIAQALVKRGYSVYIQDQTQVTFTQNVSVTREGQERALIESLSEASRFASLIHLPWHRRDFWGLPEGKRLADRLRSEASEKLVDRLDPDNMSIGEFFVWRSQKAGVSLAAESKPKAPAIETKAAAVAAVNDCIVCMDKKADTLVEPCGHMVACKGCSDILKRDPINAKLCVMRRQPIRFITEL